MPYARRYRRRRRATRRTRRRTYKKKKYTVSASKLRSKKVDTLIERRIVALSKKEVRKAVPVDYLMTRGLWYNTNAIDPATGNAYPPISILRDQWPTVDRFLQLTPTAFYYRQIAKVGGYLAEDWSAQLQAIGVDARSMHVRLKHIVTQFHFVNVLNKAVQVDIQIGRYAYDKQMLFLSQTGGTNEPTSNPQPVYQDHKPFCTWNNLTAECRKFYKERNASTGDFNRKFSVLARKRITLKPSGMMDNPAPTSQVPPDPGQGQPVDWHGLFSASVSASERINKIKYTSCRLAKYWKGLGKRERYQILPANVVPQQNTNNGSLADARYYYSIRVSEPCLMLGVSAVKFCSGKGLDRMVVFDLGAVGAQ